VAGRGVVDNRCVRAVEQKVDAHGIRPAQPVVPERVVEPEARPAPAGRDALHRVGGAAAAGFVYQLQRSAGNRAVGTLLSRHIARTPARADSEAQRRPPATNAALARSVRDLHDLLGDSVADRRSLGQA
jgi:hypothetical protein